MDFSKLKFWQRKPDTKLVKRAFDGARVNRLTADWVTAPLSTRSELRVYLRTLRARSRELGKNNGYIKKFFGMVVGNVVGPTGIKLQVRASGDDEFDVLDIDLNKKVEQAWKKWCHKEFCSTSGKLSWLDAQKLFMRTMARDGEVLVRKVYDKKNPYRFSLKFIDASWLDEQWNAREANGNRTIMSVEHDANDRVVAFWLKPPVEEYTFPGATWDDLTNGERKRFKADEFIHSYLYEDENQARGVPWVFAAMQDTKILGGYVEAELTAARVAACKMGFITPPESEEFEGDSSDPNAPPIVDNAEPGQWTELPPGHTIQEWNPDHPNTNFGAFMKGALRSIASGLEVSYNSLANDLEGVNYSSIRAGLLEERDVWKGLQQFMIEHFCRPVYQEWLQMAFLSGQLDITLAEYERVKEPSFQPRGWAWVDPLKDIQASILEIGAGLASKTDVLASQGDDYEEVMTQLAKEKKIAEGYGLSFDMSTQKPAGQPAATPQE